MNPTKAEKYSRIKDISKTAFRYVLDSIESKFLAMKADECMTSHQVNSCTKSLARRNQSCK